MYGAGDVRVENVPDAHLVEPTDALVRVTRAGICGSDLWPYKSMEPTESGRRMGHEFIGIVEAVGDEVRTIKTGDLVVSPFLWSDGSCVFCREGLQIACLHGGRYGFDDVDGGQGEACASRRQTARSSCCRSARRRADALAADAVRRGGDRPPRRGLGQGRAR
jgi:threonine dehydrogenase-like Zn-dependent dehydrogenase